MTPFLHSLAHIPMQVLTLKSLTTTRFALFFAIVLVSLFSLESYAEAQAPQVTAAPFVEGLDRPVHVTGISGDPRVFIALQSGLIYMKDKWGQLRIFLDLRDRTYSLGEEGLLHFVFDPDYSVNGYVYVYYISNVDRHAYWSRFSQNQYDPSKADPSTEYRFYDFNRTGYSNRNGGAGYFGPTDGYFYFSLGDNKDRDSAQDLASQYGKFMCIDVRQPDTVNGLPYTIPTTNPFYNQAGALKEVFARGFRNPWRWSFDTNGSIYVGDVGHATWEEISAGSLAKFRGSNYGWGLMEGPECFPLPSECDTAGKFLRLPIYSYNHDIGTVTGQAATGGVVYHGSVIPSLQNKYVFGDYIAGWVKVMDANPDSAVNVIDITSALNFPEPIYVSSFGIDGYGEVYICDYLGTVYKIIPSSGFSSDCNGNLIEDTLDVQYGIWPDCNDNLIPDQCDPDLDGNGVPDDCPTCCILAGDADQNGRCNIGDVTILISYMFTSEPPIACQDQADANGDNRLNVGDITFLISYVFSGGAPVQCGTTGH